MKPPAPPAIRLARAAPRLAVALLPAQPTPEIAARLAAYRPGLESFAAAEAIRHELVCEPVFTAA